MATRVRRPEAGGEPETIVFGGVVSAHDQGVAIGGDVMGDVVGQQIVQNLYQASDFHEPDLEPVASPGFESPPVTSELVQTLSRHRLVLLGGARFEDKETLARHLAWVLLQRRDGNGDGPGLAVKECVCGAGALDLDQELERTRRPTLFLLQRAEVRHVGFSLEAVHKRVVVGRHFLLVTTDAARTSWLQGRSTLPGVVWRELTSREVYPVAYLAHELRRRLADGELPPTIYPDGAPDEWQPGLDRPLVAGLSLGAVAERLDSPEDVRLLVEWIRAAEPPVGAREILARIEELQGDDAAVQSWYRRREPRHQLLAAGLLFFDGLFDDQLFGALDVAVARAWRFREPGLESFDYHDLDALDTYFRRSATAASGVRVESRSDGQAEALRRAVWRFHRRQLVSLLPVVSDLVREAGTRAWRQRVEEGGNEVEFQRARGARPPAKEARKKKAEPAGGQEAPQGQPSSPAEPAPAAARDRKPEATASLSRWEEYGPAREIMSSPERRQRLCEVISRSLGRIGLLSVHTVERCLLELARHGSWEAQEVAAQALASWREGSDEELLFRFLREWYEEASRREADLSRRARLRPGTTWSYEHAHIRATVSMAIFYVALDEEPDGLAPPLVELLAKLVHDPSDRVRVRFRSSALPAVVARHVRQLDRLVWDLVRYRDLIEPVAVGWGLAYTLRPEVASALVEEWRRRCLAQPPVAPTRIASPREARLATVALTYGYIDYDHPDPPLTPVAALAKLEGLLSEEHPFVRGHLLTTVGRLISGHLDQIRHRLPAFVEQVPLDDRWAIVAALVDAYRIERRDLIGGQGTIEVGGARYAVWIGAGRPPTLVERVLERWLCDSTQPAAQQVAFSALAACAGSDVDVAEAHWRHGQGAARSSAVERRRLARHWQPGPPRPSVRRAPASIRLLLWLLTVGREDLRSTLQHVAAELPEQLRRFTWAVGSLLFGWQRRRDEVGTLGRYLSRIAEIYRRRKAISIGLAVLGLLVAIFVWRTLSGGE